LKLDIEGWEYRVLTRFFEDVARVPRLKPKYLLVEIEGFRQPEAWKRRLREAIVGQGYRTLLERDNSLFELVSNAT
jgi:hypothetical protein